MDYWLYFLASAVGGLLVGVLGTGSSLVVLPSLALIFAGTMPGYDTLRLAAGTTMATMAAGAIAGAIMQYRAGHLDMRLFRLTLLPYVTGALIGPWISRFLPTPILSVYLAVIIAIVAMRMLFAKGNKLSSSRDYHKHQVQISVVLVCISICSSVAGVASGIFAIPYLMRFSLPMRTIIGTSTAAAAVYSTFGGIGYVTAGWSASNLPEGAFGFVYLPAFAILAITASIITPVGVRLAGYVNDQVLKRFLAVLLIVAAFAIVFF